MPRTRVTDEPPVVREPVLDSTRGRGLAIVGALSADAGRHPTAQGKVVWFEVIPVWPYVPPAGTPERAGADDPPDVSRSGRGAVRTRTRTRSRWGRVVDRGGGAVVTAAAADRGPSGVGTDGRVSQQAPPIFANISRASSG